MLLTKSVSNPDITIIYFPFVWMIASVTSILVLLVWMVTSVVSDIYGYKLYIDYNNVKRFKFYIKLFSI